MKKIKNGTVIHSNDKYFSGSDNFSKNRESVVVAKNNKNHLGLVKLTTRSNPNTKSVPGYGKSLFDKRNVYTKDNEGKPIHVSNAKKIDNLNKFIASSFSNISNKSVKIIKNTVLSDSKYGKRNADRLEKLKKEAKRFH